MAWKIGLGAAAVLALLVGVLVLAAAIAQWRFERAWQQQATRLSATLPAPAAPAPPALDALPAPVQRYLRFAMPDGVEALGHVRFTHGGAFRLEPGGAWLPMTAREHLFAGRPAFLWNARIRLAPGVHVVVHDFYAAGRGGVDPRLLGAWPLGPAGGPELAQSALLRYLAEAVLLPPALLPGPWLHWEPMDAHHARAVVRDAGIAVSAVFTFAEDGRITAFETAERYRTVGDTAVPTPFYGRMADYRRFGALRVPTRLEAGWRIAGEDFTYVRMALDDLEAVPP